jgi:putative transcriptional regulator
MRLMRFRRGLLAFAVLLASATLCRAALPEPDASPAAATLTGQLLVATPEMGDPHFYHTVILLVRHGEGGAFGIIINRPTEERPWASLMARIGEDGSGLEGSVRIFEGGPVDPDNGFVLHSAEYHRGHTISIDDHVAMTSSVEVLRDLAHHAGPQKSLVAFGYAGWAPGQLEHEMTLNAWFTIPDDPKLLFDEDRDKVWDKAVARRTIPL